MPRLQFQPAAHYAFATEMPIEPGQINEGGHLDNVQLLALVSVARTRFFAWLGYSVLDVAGHAFFVADQAVQYRSEGQPGEVLRIERAHRAQVELLGLAGLDLQAQVLGGRHIGQ